MQSPPARGAWIGTDPVFVYGRKGKRELKLQECDIVLRAWIEIHSHCYGKESVGK